VRESGAVAESNGGKEESHWQRGEKGRIGAGRCILYLLGGEKSFFLRGQKRKKRILGGKKRKWGKELSVKGPFRRFTKIKEKETREGKKKKKKE